MGVANFSERELNYVHVRYICCSPSVCRLSVICLSAVTLVRRSQAVEIFGNFPTQFGTLAIR